jgi:hypothetical protein
MYYCDDCRIKNKWPDSFTYSRGKCECCGASARCWDRPSSTLPPVEFSQAIRAPSPATTAGERQSIADDPEFVVLLKRIMAASERVDNYHGQRLIAHIDTWAARSAGDAVPASEQPKWAAVRTVGDMVRNLLTLDQASPIHAAFHVDFDGARRCRTRPVWISRERVIDGKWVDGARKDVPYEIVVWAKPAEDEARYGAAPAPGNTAQPSGKEE